MKKIGLFFIVVLSVLNCTAQDSVILKSHYLPLHIYDQTITQNMVMVMTIESKDSTVMATLKDKKADVPITVNTGTNSHCIITTGKMAKNVFPIELKIKKYTTTLKTSNESLSKSLNADTTIILPDETTFFGKDTLYRLAVYDSVMNEKGENDKNDAFLKIVKKISSQTSLPNKKMGINDEYSLQNTLTLPFTGFSLHMNYTTIYKLISIQDSTASFDIKMKFILINDLTDLSLSITGSGEGDGILVYNRKNEFPVKEDLHYTINANAAKETILIKELLTSNSSYSYIIGDAK